MAENLEHAACFWKFGGGNRFCLATNFAHFVRLVLTIWEPYANGSVQTRADQSRLEEGSSIFSAVEIVGDSIAGEV